MLQFLSISGKQIFFDSQVPLSEKYCIFEFKNAQNYILLYVAYSTKYFLDKNYTILKITMVMVSLRNAKGGPF